MQDIVVRRYPNPTEIGWAGWIEPRDLAWIAFIDLQGRPVFYLHRDPETGAILPDDPAERDRALAQIRGGLADGFPGGPSRKPPPMPGWSPMDLSGPGALDYRVVPEPEPMMDALDAADHAREQERFPNRRSGFTAYLNARSIGCWGETEHAAVQSLLNYVARLCVAGHLDHTGRPRGNTLVDAGGESTPKAE